MMRFLSATVLTLALLGAAEVRAANPYEVFRLGMSEAEVRDRIQALGSAPYSDMEGDEPTDTCTDEFCILAAFIPTPPESAETYFVFRSNRLAILTFSYYLLPHMSPPYLTEAECDEHFRHIVKNMEAIFGSPSGRTVTPEGPSRTTIFEWKSSSVTADAQQFIHGGSHPTASGPLCGILNSQVFAGSEDERRKFDADMSDAIARNKQP